MKLKLKTAILKLLFILNEIIHKYDNLPYTKNIKKLQLQIKNEDDQKKIDGLKGIVKVLNRVHTTSYRTRKLNHFKPIRNVKKRNRQPKNSQRD
jgi:hypothetical protein